MKTLTPPYKKTGVIYALHCECGGTYIGETGKTFKIRMSEHKRTMKNGDQNNALSLHVHSTGHAILWDKCEILGVEQNWQRRKIKESIIINKKYTQYHQHRSWSTHQPFLEHCLTITVKTPVIFCTPLLHLHCHQSSIHQ